jgi:hypothetical protein
MASVSSFQPTVFSSIPVAGPQATPSFNPAPKEASLKIDLHQKPAATPTDIPSVPPITPLFTPSIPTTAPAPDTSSVPGVPAAPPSTSTTASGEGGVQQQVFPVGLLSKAEAALMMMMMIIILLFIHPHILASTILLLNHSNGFCLSKMKQETAFQFKPSILDPKTST